MKNLTDEEVTKLKETNGLSEVHRFDDDEIDLHVVFKVPSWQTWSAYKREIADPETRLKVVKKMVATHLLHPTAAEFEAFSDGRPASVEVVMGEIGEVAGLRNAGVRKKL